MRLFFQLSFQLANCEIQAFLARCQSSKQQRSSVSSNGILRSNGKTEKTTVLAPDLEKHPHVLLRNPVQVLAFSAMKSRAVVPMSKFEPKNPLEAFPSNSLPRNVQSPSRLPLKSFPTKPEEASGVDIRGAWQCMAYDPRHFQPFQPFQPFTFCLPQSC